MHIEEFRLELTPKKLKLTRQARLNFYSMQYHQILLDERGQHMEAYVTRTAKNFFQFVPSNGYAN